MSALAALGKIGVLYGGESAERAISLRSGHAVLAALQSLRADVVGIDVRFNEELFKQLSKIDAAFIALHGRGGEDGVIQGLLEVLNIPYTGSGVSASAIGMDKLRTKLIWSGLGLPTPDFKSVTSSEGLDGVLESMGGAVMVKPPHEGSSIGMSRATTEAELVAAVDKALDHDDVILLERWVQGAEYTCAILGEEALPVIRLKTPNQFYDFDAKYQSSTTEYLIPSGLGDAQEERLQQLSLQAFSAVGCKGWGRVDAMMDEAGHFWLLEVNTVPGMTDHSLVPMAAKAKGYSFEQLVEAIALGAKG
ncbi:MAG: D-alanine--D-alanine ligase [Pseudomonadales bacterium]|jgi:D-alanine-D-alanine ligase|nr:D-alanine--D-alanine ligase [Pseudomonadales bacterium]MEC8811067.1 D-alanine--D-alanine ligase [Pseudomonadota bacterium]TNC88318.1 MAG: D-alanine--D-alanine ligase [Alcanivorax sp.]HAG95354.1 D-alanine--D-alanine ligase [Gammaproteobacteria bacterium]MBI25929.1 D-alanine--D-alanine ligase [Pseudomonadales bacterium]|tara:strand:+ start:48182 stop:49099 length:918 start_codon:yes stop_codon:yes gene_type:complete